MIPRPKRAECAVVLSYQVMRRVKNKANLSGTYTYYIDSVITILYSAQQ